MPDQTQASTAVSERESRSSAIDPNRFKLFRQLTLVLLAAGVFAIAFYTILSLATGVWQIAAEAGLIVVGLVCLAIAYRAARRGHFDPAGYLVLFGLGLVYGGPELFWSGATAYLAIGGLMLIILVGSLLLPHKPRSWFIAAGLFSVCMWLANRVNWLPRYDYSQSPFLSLFVPFITAALTIAAVGLMMRGYAGYSLRTKLFIGFLLAALVPLGIQAVSNDNSTRGILSNSANQSLNTAAAQTASEIDNFFTNQINQLKIDALLPNTLNFLNLSASNRAADSIFERDTSDVLRMLANNTALPASEFESTTSQPIYYLLDTNGLVAASSNRFTLGKSMADQSYFLQPIQELKAYVSPVNFTGVGQLAYFYISLPVLDTAQKPIGVLVVQYNSNVLQAITASYNNLAGPQSHPVVFDVVNGNYIYIAHGLDSNTVGIAVGPLDETTAQQLQAIHRLANRPLNLLSTNLPELNNSLLNAAAQPDFATKDVGTGDQLNQVAIAAVKSEPWLVGFFLPQRVFLQPAAEQSQNNVKLVLAIGVLVAAAAVGVAQLLTGPIVRLTTVATRITAGDLSARARVETSDEIGALANGFNTMTAQLQELIGSLEKRVEARTEQLRASTEVGRAAASILDTDRLLREVVNLITDRFGFYYSAIFLNDERNQFAVLHEATGEAGRILKDRRHQLEIGGQSMVSTAITTRQPRIALDTGAEPVRFANPLLPETRSEIALPLIVGDRTLGALDVQSTQASAFDETYASVLQSMADQIAIAVSNTQQFSQTEAALRQTNILYEAGRKIAVADNAAGILAAIITQAAPEADGSALIVFGPIDQYGQVSFLESAAVYADHPTDFKLPAGARYRPEQLPIAATTAALEPIVIEDSEKADLHLKQSLTLLGARAAISLPLTAGSRHIGTLILSYRQPRSFSHETVQILQALASQAAVVVQSQQLLAETQTTLKQLDAINRRLTGQAWRDYTASNGSLRVVDVGPGVPAAAATSLIESAVEADRVQVVGPIGDTRSGLIAPIALRGEVVGTLSLQEIDNDRVWTDNEIALLQTVANDVAVAIENARLIEQTERRAERERLITEVSTRMFATNDLHTIVKVAGDELARILHMARTEVQISGEYLSSTADDASTDDRHGQ